MLNLLTGAGQTRFCGDKRIYHKQTSCVQVCKHPSIRENDIKGRDTKNAFQKRGSERMQEELERISEKSQTMISCSWIWYLWRSCSRPGCQSPQRKYAGYLSPTLRKMKVSGSRNSNVIRETMRKEMKWRKKSKSSEATLTTCMDDYGMNGDSNLSHSVRASYKEDNQRTTTLTDNKQERLRKRRIFNAWWLMHWHQLRSQILQVFQVTSHIVWIFTLCFVSSIQFVAVPIYSISDLYANLLYSFTLRKRSFEVLSLHHPSVTVDRRQL